MYFFSETLVSSRRHISELMFPVLGDRCSWSKMTLIGSEGWLYMFVNAFRHIDSAVLRVDIVKL